jgi:hypothetical protein
MLTCPNPTCRKTIAALERECPRCRADLSLLVDYVDHLQDGLTRADTLTRSGELGEAVWAYLGVLEVDPDNATARRQVGQVVTAVRQFDRSQPGRRWMRRVEREARFRDWLHGLAYGGGCLSTGIWVLIVFGALLLGYVMGATSGPPREQPGEEKAAPIKPEKNRAGERISG